MGKPAKAKSKMPTDRPTDKLTRKPTTPAVSARPTGVVPDEHFYPQGDLRTLTEAEEIQRNHKRMEAVKQHAAKAYEISHRKEAMKPHKNDKVVK